ncbi:RNA ligase family protein [Fictibacillus terranigra]|uniref:DNA ligase (ATP) n=1 Tax=Fictibacillus terranigra TaxID=3058424 RepID=A0ABT8E8Z2_9BACL|nr:RNA ligase family protein [Fictibacillus sp. CENA-BCM004]MDN4074369.1 RNA ligase family protein [Fictibacillus sp. CENA-BCM004]
MKPITPMEPKMAARIPTTSDWTAQIKWDGVHVLTYYDGREAHLFNRKRRERTLNYPELTNVPSYCSAHSVILDGEIISLADDGRPSFHKVMKRDGIRNPSRIPAIQSQVPITYMIFDVLFYNGEWVTDQPFKERQKLLSNIIIPNEHVQLVRSHDDGEALFDAIKQTGMEGIVMKQLDSRYYIGEKNEVWIKIKNTRDLIAAIGGFTLRDGIVNSILLGLYDRSGEFIYIGHTGTGKLSVLEWRELTKQLLPLEIKQPPFINSVGRHSDAHWVKPHITAKIHFAEWTEGQKLRQPSIQAFVDVPPTECVLVEET